MARYVWKLKLIQLVSIRLPAAAVAGRSQCGKHNPADQPPPRARGEQLQLQRTAQPRSQLRHRRESSSHVSPPRLEVGPLNLFLELRVDVALTTAVSADLARPAAERAALKDDVVSALAETFRSTGHTLEVHNVKTQDTGDGRHQCPVRDSRCLTTKNRAYCPPVGGHAHQPAAGGLACPVFRRVRPGHCSQGGAPRPTHRLRTSPTCAAGPRCVTHHSCFLFPPRPLASATATTTARAC